MSDAINALMDEGGSGTPWAKFPTLMSVVKGVIVSIDQRQRTDFTSKEKIENKDGTPAMEVVVVLQTDERDPEIENDTGLRALHAPQWYFPGCLRLALLNAVTASGNKAPAIGGTFTVQHNGMDGQAKTYVATYEAPNVLAAPAIVEQPAPIAEPVAAPQPASIV